MSERKFIVITSINAPTDGVRGFASWPGWETVVVGDRKTPAEKWAGAGVTYLGPEEQAAQFPELAAAIPENTYRRKMIGYAYAIRNGATAILDSDDDNIPYADAPAIVDDALAGSRLTGERRAASNLFLNIYDLFGAHGCWPRGFPLECVRALASEIRDGKDATPWAVMQFMADEDPDVDAVYRMIRNQPVYFARKRRFILDAGTYCPINSQATLWTPEAFPLLFLPACSSDRVTDILRGYIATRCLWHGGRAVAFSSPIVYQRRNHHDLHADFLQESDLYAHARAWCWALNLREMKAKDMAGRYRACLEVLAGKGAAPGINGEIYGRFLHAAGIE